MAGSILAGDLLQQASTILSDSEGVTWTEDELLTWLNAGQRAIVDISPSAYQVREAIPLMPFDAYQELPAGVIRLVKTLRNVRPDQATKGMPVRVLSDAQLDNIVPNWMSAPAADDVQHVMYDSVTPGMFFVYPPIGVYGFLECVVSRMPPDIQAWNQTIQLDDVYANPLLDYMLHRTFAKNAEVAGSAELAQTFFGLFTQQVNAKIGGDSIAGADNKGARDRLPSGSSASA